MTRTLGGGAGTKGLTKYYEYGRYDQAEMGITRRIPVPDVALGADGRGDEVLAH